MDISAGARGTQSRPTGRKPGWFARRPAMTILSAPLHLGVARSLRPMANRLSGWSHSLASRCLPRHPAQPAWQATLDFSTPNRRTAADRRGVSRLPGMTGGKLFIQRRLQTLSLPEGLRIEEPSPDNWADDDFSMEAGQPVAPDAGYFSQAGVQPVSFTGLTPPDQSIAPANFQAASVKPGASGDENPSDYSQALSDRPVSPPNRAQFARPAPGGPTRQTTNTITSPQWPFRLVRPIITTKPACCTCLPAQRGGVQERAHFPAARKRSFRRASIFFAGRPVQPSHQPGQSRSYSIALDRQANGSPAACHYYHSTFYSRPAFGPRPAAAGAVRKEPAGPHQGFPG